MKICTEKIYGVEPPLKLIVSIFALSKICCDTKPSTKANKIIVVLIFLENDFKNSVSIIEPIHKKYLNYVEANKDTETNRNVLYTSLDEIDTIQNEYKLALDKLKNKDYNMSSDQNGGNAFHSIDKKYISGGNPMMMDPYGMSATNQLLAESMEEDYKLESMKEMIKYTEEEENTLNELKFLDNSIVNIESDFTNITLSFVVVAFSIFVSYKLINNSLTFKSELFNGKIFGEGICYK